MDLFYVSLGCYFHHLSPPKLTIRFSCSGPPDAFRFAYNFMEHLSHIMQLSKKTKKHQCQNVAELFADGLSSACFPSFSAHLPG